MIYFEKGSETLSLGPEDLRLGLSTALEKIGSREKVLIVPPDVTRIHSFAGDLTVMAYSMLGSSVKGILPALGTHSPMTGAEIDRMFPGVPHNLFMIHDWRNDVVTAGVVPGSFLAELTDGAITYDWPAQLNANIMNGGHDLILSVGQVVPHEVIGMANYNKNIFVGTGGAEAINKSHFAGAVYGMERIMGRADNPVRALLNYASEKFINHLPLIYVLTVVGRSKEGRLEVRGLFIGDDEEVFRKAADLSLKVNLTLLDEPLDKVIVYLDPQEYRSTWLGNKSVYRTRMAIADHGDLVVIAPGVKEFGEDKEIDRLIRKYGYRGTKSILQAVLENEELSNNLSAAAHLIHGSSEGRFSITYCTPLLTRREVESVNFRYDSIEKVMARYNPDLLKDGYNIMDDGEKVFYISNPSLGLWATKSIFNS